MICSSNIKSSFDTLLKLHEVIWFGKLAVMSLTLEQKSPAAKNKLDSVMARLDRLCSGDDNDDESEHERWAGLFK
jgi:hypothetical protein